MLSPPESFSTQLLGTLELKPRTIGTPIEHITPSTRIESVHPAQTRERVSLTHECLPCFHRLGCQLLWGLCGKLDRFHTLVVVVEQTAGWIARSELTHLQCLIVIELCAELRTAVRFSLLEADAHMEDVTVLGVFVEAGWFTGAVEGYAGYEELF